MTSLHKVKDATKIASKSRPRRTGVSAYAEVIDAVLELKPPEGVMIDVPAGVRPEKFRRRIRAIITRKVELVSPHRYRVSIAVNGQILVGCLV